MTRAKSGQVLEIMMRRVTAIVSTVAVVMMAVGFVVTFLFHSIPAMPGTSALPINAVWHFQANDWGLWAMSAGILLLALIPMLRVLLSLWIFVRARHLLDALVAVIILAELLISMRVR